MTIRPAATVSEHFSGVEDPRVACLVTHPLINIMTITLCAVIAGADNWSEVATFGEGKKEWLAKFLDMSEGTPSHDTFSLVFARLNPEQLQDSFISWVRAVYQRLTGEVVAVDGKKLRHSFDSAEEQPMITMVSAWATEAEVVLGQLTVTEGSNEITAIPKLLRLLDLKGCIVTIDAIGCQKEIAQQIVDQEADYLLAVKGNQEHLLADIELLFRLAEENDFAKVDCNYARTVNKGHNRIEVRHCWAISGEESLQFLQNYEEWPKLRTVIRIMSERHIGQSVSRQYRYYISSLPNDAEHLLQVKRSHWAIENGLHWVLDVAFREDDSRVRKGNGARNLALFRHMAVNLLKNEKTAKGGIHNKRMQAAWNEQYLVKVLSGGMR
jgi:predicted transposase YbfD/YdcC